MARTTESLDLTELFQVLVGWRQVAQLTEQLGHDGYRDFEARTRSRIATRHAEGADSEVRTGVEEIDALIQARLAQARGPTGSTSTKYDRPSPPFRSRP